MFSFLYACVSCSDTTMILYAEAASCLERAVNIFCEIGRLNMAARYYKVHYASLLRVNWIIKSFSMDTEKIDYFLTRASVLPSFLLICKMVTGFVYFFLGTNCCFNCFLLW